MERKNPIMNKSIHMRMQTGRPIHLLAEQLRGQFLGSTEISGPQPADHRRVVLYSHDTMGIGHMRRNILIAQLIQERFANVSILVIAGARVANTFAQLAGIDCLTLPSFQKHENGSYSTRNLGISAKDVLDVRSQTILAAIQSYKPDLLIADKIPSGAGGELLPALEWLRQHTTCRCILGLREILDSADEVIRDWHETSAFDIIRRYFGSIWIYGDRTVYDAIEEYEFPLDIGERVTFTGYLDTRIRLANHPRDVCAVDQPYVLCTVGGGQDGKQLPLTFIEATRKTGRTAVLLTGPLMPESARSQVAAAAENVPSLKVIDFADEGDAFVKHASHVVSMGGYNTLAAILSHNKPALIVPRVTPREEQLIRANRLAELGLVDALHPRDLTADSIVQWLDRTTPNASHPATQIDMGGLNRIGELVQAEVPGILCRNR
jgi:predicted glycosyltransferase